MIPKLTVGDSGTAATFHIVDPNGVSVNLSSATIMTLAIKKPSNVVLHKTLTFLTDGRDGWVNYVLAPGDIDQPGQYQMQTHITTPDGTWSSSTAVFDVAQTIG
jgi:hypothetical protein